jgi:hypothetical protein
MFWLDDLIPLVIFISLLRERAIRTNPNLLKVRA